LRRAVVDGDIERGSLMAGQSVAFVKRVEPVAAIIEDLVQGAERMLAEMAGGLVTENAGVAVAPVGSPGSL